MPFIKVFIHFVWSTKNRIPVLETKELRQEMWNHIYENAKEKKIFIECINGYFDHCHCLVSLGVNQNIQKIIQLIKGESAFWFNKYKIGNHKMEWQDEYFAVSVSESMFDVTKKYILNQEEHHKVKSFQEEYNEFIEKYGFKKFG